MGKVYVTVDGKKKSFDTKELAKAYTDTLPDLFKKSAVITDAPPKEEELSNVETKIQEATEESVALDEAQHALEEAEGEAAAKELNDHLSDLASADEQADVDNLNETKAE